MRTKLSILFWIIQSSTKSLARARTVPKFLWKEYSKWLNEGNKGIFRYEINP